MNAERVVAVVVVCIAALTLATGPLGPLDIGTDSGSIEDPGTGSATVEVVSAPGAVELVPSDDGQELLHLSVPTTTVRTSNVTGAELSVTLRGENQTTVFERTVPVERP